MVTPALACVQPAQEYRSGRDKAIRGIFAEPKLPLDLISTDLSVSLGLGAGCYAGQPGSLYPAHCPSQTLAEAAAPGPSNAIHLHALA